MRPDDAAELHPGRRGFLGSAGSLAAASLLGGTDAQASAQATGFRSGVAPFRGKVVIASKFGWNIDPLTGAWRPGLNSRPDHIKLAVEGMLKLVNGVRHG